MRPGSFAWFDLMASDPAGAEAFYGALFGWTVHEGRFTWGGAPFAGLMPVDPESGWPTHWLPYVQVEDVDAVGGRALLAGGDVLLPPTDIPGIGRFIVCADPMGAPFSALESSQGGTGVFAWAEILTADDRVGAFYAEVFGYTCEGGLFSRGGEAHAGIRRWRGAPCWVPYVGVADVEGVVARAEALGATVLERPFRGGDGARYAVIADPGGGVFGVVR